MTYLDEERPTAIEEGTEEQIITDETVNLLSSSYSLGSEEFGKPTIIVNGKEHSYSPIFGRRRVYPEILKERERPGLLRTYYEGVKRGSTFGAAYRSIERSFKMLAATTSEQFVNDDPDWTPYTEEALMDVDEGYWGYILSAKSREDQELRREEVLSKMQWNEYIESGSIFASLAGNFTGAIFLSPESYMNIVMGAGKFVSLAFATRYALTRAVPAVAAQAAIYNGMDEFSKLDANLESFALNTLRDTVFGTALWGAGGTYTAIARKKGIWEARKLVNANFEGFDVKIKASKDGKFDGFKAIATDAADGSISAAQVQEFLDNKAVENALSKTILKIGKTPVVGSPLIRGLMSPYKIVQDVYAFLGNRSIITHGIERGIPRAATGEDIVNLFVDASRRVSQEFRSLYHKNLGIEPGITSTPKAIIKNLTEGRSASIAEFSEDVARTIVTGQKHANPVVNEAASLIKSYQEDVYKQFLRAYGFPEDILPPRTAIGYLTRMYNIRNILKDERGFVQSIVNDLIEQDKMIKSFRQVEMNIRETIKSLNKEAQTPGGRSIREIRNDIRRAKTQLKAEIAKQQQLINSGQVDPCLLADRIYLTQTERAELAQIRKGLESLDNKIKNLQRNMPNLDKNQQIAARKKIKDLKMQRENEMGRILTDDTINKKYFIGTGTKRSLRPLQDPPKFRKTYEDEIAMWEDATGYKDSILGNTTEDLTQSMLSAVSGGTMVNPTKARTLLVRDTAIMNYTISDMGLILDNYSRSLGRRIAIKQVFGYMDAEDGVETLANNMLSEYEAKKMSVQKQREAAIAKAPQGDGREKYLASVQKQFEKESLRLNKEFKSNRDLLEWGYKQFMGISSYDKNSMRAGRAIRNLISVTRLRNVPLLQITEPLAIAFRQGFWNLTSAGLLKIINKTVNPLISKAKRDAIKADYKANASHAYLGLDMITSRFSNSVFEGQSLHQIPPTVIEGALDWMAQDFAPKMFGTAYITAALKNLSANVSQSRIMADLFAVEAGTASKAVTRRLLVNGIDPKDAKAYIAQYKAAGGHKLHGGHVSYWYNWEDAVLKNKMLMAIRNDSSASILEAGIFDKPAWARDPIAGLPFALMGYVYSAYNNFTAPFFQTLEGQKFVALITMSALASVIEPMRAFQKGEVFDPDNEQALDQWFMSGMLESGVFGFPAEFIGIFSALTDMPGLNRYNNDKFKRRGVANLIAGPAGGIGQDVMDIVRMISNGTYNQNDIRKMKNLIPIANNLALDAMINRAIKSSSLPESMADAEPYSFLNN